MGILLGALVLYPAYATMQTGFDPKDFCPKSEVVFNHNTAHQVRKAHQSRHVSRVL